MPRHPQQARHKESPKPSCRPIKPKPSTAASSTAQFKDYQKILTGMAAPRPAASLPAGKELKARSQGGPNKLPVAGTGPWRTEQTGFCGRYFFAPINRYLAHPKVASPCMFAPMLFQTDDR